MIVMVVVIVGHKETDASVVDKASLSPEARRRDKRWVGERLCVPGGWPAQRRGWNAVPASNRRRRQSVWNIAAWFGQVKQTLLGQTIDFVLIVVQSEASLVKKALSSRRRHLALIGLAAFVLKTRLLLKARKKPLKPSTDAPFDETSGGYQGRSYTKSGSVVVV